MEDRPNEWAKNVLTMNFFTDAAFTTPMDGSNQVPLGEDVHVQITTNVANEAINTRINHCWVTPDNDPTQGQFSQSLNAQLVFVKPCQDAGDVFFDLYKNDCSWTELGWVTLDPANGASPNTGISFQSLRFPGAYASGDSSFWLHCTTYMCYADGTDPEGNRVLTTLHQQNICCGLFIKTVCGLMQTTVELDAEDELLRTLFSDEARIQSARLMELSKQTPCRLKF